jgi:predicted lipoprotein with Yx(FWY)xxD motif
MPKTASKRAVARRETRVQRAHQAMPERTAVVRRVPMAAARRAQPRGFGGFIRNYPWASTIFVVLVVALVVLVMRQQQLGPFAVAKPNQAEATCNLATHVCDKAPLFTIDKNRQYTATIETTKGNIVISLNRAAQTTTNSFVFLATHHFYDGLTFWKVEHKGQASKTSDGTISNMSLIQGGAGGHHTSNDPSGHNGDAGFALKSELVPGSQTAGIVSMVNSSQFFINLEDNSSAIPGNTYNIFGTVTSGLDVAKQILPGDAIKTITITSVPVSQPQQTTHATINIATGVVVNGKTTTILVDSKGRTLYYFTDDSATKATCVGTCGQTWIALHGTDLTGVVSQLTSKIKVLAANGDQVVYNGHPLYIYGGDKAPGDVNGEGISGKWFVATPDVAVQK